MTKHTTPEYRNWVSFAHGLINVFCKRLRPFVTRETVHFYSKVSAAVAAYHGGPCTCTFVPRRRPNQYHDMRTCTWANFLQGHHHRNIPNWKQSDSTKWTDPIQGPWEIAKLFLPDLGGHAVMSAEDMDLTGILNLMYWCDHFRPIPQPLIKDLRDIRNRVWGHVTKLELTNAEKATAFGAIEALLQHPSLAHDRDAQKALHEIQLLKTVTDVDNFQAQVLKQFKEMIEEDILGLKSDSTQNREDLQQLEERLRIVENLEIVRNTNQRAGNTLGNFAKSGALLLCDNLIFCTQRISECMLAPWLVMILLFNFSVTPLDPISYIQGCPLEVGAVPFDTKEFNFTSHLNKARESFTGRIWLSHQLESLLTGSQGNNIGGVLIIGAPGTGKSAFSAQLICSSAFNPYITRRIIGYHLCRHSDVATQEPGRFVRNLVNLIARRIPEYRMLIHNSPFILRILQRSCLRDPYHCFEEAIATPLNRVTSNDFQSYFIIIDALDECSSAAGGTSLVQFIKDTYDSLPKCVHLVMTSRNDSAVLKHFSRIPKVYLSSEDVRNLQDVEIFIATKLLEDTAFLERLKVMLSFVKRDAVSYLVNRLLNQSEGNFLFAKLTLLYGKENWSNESDLNKLPTTINDQCESYFRRAFGSREKFKPALPVLEILAATFKPLKLNQIFDVLRFRQKIDFEYDFVYTLQGLSHFITQDQDSTIRLSYHTFKNWLTSKENLGNPFYVSRSRGQRRLLEYYFNFVKIDPFSSNDVNRFALRLTSFSGRAGHLHELGNVKATHIKVTSDNSKKTLLHLSSNEGNRKVLQILSHTFEDIHCNSLYVFTPAFVKAMNDLAEKVEYRLSKRLQLKHRRIAPSSPYFIKRSKKALIRDRTKRASQSFSDTKGLNLAIAFLSTWNGHQKFVKLH